MVIYRKRSRRFALAMGFTAMLGLMPVAFNAVLDPFVMNGWFDFGLDREEISQKAHYPLWKMIEYPRRGDPHIVLGDSRARALRNEYWNEVGFKDVYNFSYGGSTVIEIFDTFNYLKERTRLRTVVLGVSLRNFDLNFKGGLNRVPEAIALAEDPVGYYTSWFVAKTAWANVSDTYGGGIDRFVSLLPRAITPAKAKPDAPPTDWTLEQILDPELCKGCEMPEVTGPSNLPVVLRPGGIGLGHWADLWPEIDLDRELPGVFARQVTKNARSDWRRFDFAETLWQRIEEIAVWSRENDVRLVFVIPPTITEMQQQITNYGLAAENQRFRARLAALAPVVDLDFDNALTRDLSHFTDAYHFNPTVGRAVVGELVKMINTDPAINRTADRRRGLVLCPMVDEAGEVRMERDGLVMREGKNCRIWSQSHS